MINTKRNRLIKTPIKVGLILKNVIWVNPD